MPRAWRKEQFDILLSSCMYVNDQNLYSQENWFKPIYSNDGSESKFSRYSLKNHCKQYKNVWRNIFKLKQGKKEGAVLFCMFF